MGSFSSSPGGAAPASSGMRLLRRWRRYVFGRRMRFDRDKRRLDRSGGALSSKERFVVGIGLGDGTLGGDSLAGSGIQGAARRALRGRTGGENRLMLLDFQAGDFLLDLCFKLIRSAFEFVHCLADLAGDIRQLFRTKDD